MMQKFKFTKKSKYAPSTRVWYGEFFLGTIELQMKERDDIDWQSLRQDKTKKLAFHERWQSYYYARSTTGYSSMGPFDSKEDASVALVNEHKRALGEENER